MATMDDLILSFNGGAHVSQDLKALQDYLAQNLMAPPLALPSNPSTAFRPLPASRSTSTTRGPMAYPQAHSFPHDGFFNQAAYSSPLVQTPFPGEDHAESSTTGGMSSRPHTLRRSSSYGFSYGQQPSSPYTEYQAFEGDAFAPLVQPEYPADPWARWKQSHPVAVEQPSSTSPWAAFAAASNAAQGKAPPIPAFGQHHAHAALQKRFQSPAAVCRAAREEDEMMDAEMADMTMEEDEDEVDAVEREMALAEGAHHIVRPESAPGAIGSNWRERGLADWERGRRAF